MTLGIQQKYLSIYILQLALITEHYLAKRVSNLRRSCALVCRGMNMLEAINIQDGKIEK